MYHLGDADSFGERAVPLTSKWTWASRSLRLIRVMWHRYDGSESESKPIIGQYIPVRLLMAHGLAQ